MTELFQIEPVLSPRLKWMEWHGITTHEVHHNKQCKPWIAWVGRLEQALGNCSVVCDNTEDAALVELAKKLNLRLWNEV